MSVNVKFSNGEIQKVDKISLYDASLLDGSTVIIGKPGTGKTHYICNCLKQGFLPGIEEIYYVGPSSTLTIKRENELFSIFEKYNLYIYRAEDKEGLENSLDQISTVVCEQINDENIYKENDDDYEINTSGGENPSINRLLLLDDMTTIADKSQKFVNFLTRSRKLGFSVVIIFHDISSNKGVWPVINSVANRFIFFNVGNPSNICNFMFKFSAHDKYSQDGVRYSSKNQNWLFNTYKSEVKYVGDHLMIDTNVGNKELNDGSVLAFVRTKTSGILQNKDGKGVYSYKQYIHKNNGKGSHSSFISERVTVLDKNFKNIELSGNKVIYCITESLTVTDSGQTARSRTFLNNFTHQVSYKRTAEEIDNISLGNKKELDTKNNKKIKQEGGILPIYLRNRNGKYD